MRCYLIDPAAMTVEPRDDILTYDDRKAILGDVGNFMPAPLDGVRLLVWCDDIGLMREEVAPLFQIEGYGQPVAGKAIVIALDNEEGDQIDWPEGLRPPSVTFLPGLEFAGFEDKEGYADHPAFGRVWKIERHARFKPKGAK